MGTRIAVIGDYKPEAIAHQANPEAIRLAAETLGCQVERKWISTPDLRDVPRQLDGFDGIWCVPATPYENTEGALEAIRFARERKLPFLGTCGGFQHMLVEFARNVCGLADADFAETNPGARSLLIAPLECSLIETTGDIRITEDGIVRRAYGADKITEGYHCSYGVNPQYESLLTTYGLRVTARDAAGEVRAMELPSNLFFAGTLFQPERRALRGEVPPLVLAFLAAARATSS